MASDPADRDRRAERSSRQRRRARRRAARCPAPLRPQPAGSVSAAAPRTAGERRETRPRRTGRCSRRLCRTSAAGRCGQAVKPGRSASVDERHAGSGSRQATRSARDRSRGRPSSGRTERHGVPLTAQHAGSRDTPAPSGEPAPQSSCEAPDSGAATARSAVAASQTIAAAQVRAEARPDRRSRHRAAPHAARQEQPIPRVPVREALPAAQTAAAPETAPE